MPTQLHLLLRTACPTHAHPHAYRCHPPCPLFAPFSYRRGLKSTDDKYFTGKKRYTHVVMQGRFKHDVSAADLWTGHEWFQVTDLVPTR
jgi:hypothetical protein